MLQSSLDRNLESILFWAGSPAALQEGAREVHRHGNNTHTVRLSVILLSMRYKFVNLSIPLHNKHCSRRLLYIINIIYNFPFTPQNSCRHSSKSN